VLSRALLALHPPQQQRIAGFGLTLTSQARRAEQLALAFLGAERLLGLLYRPFKLSLTVRQFFQLRLSGLPGIDAQPFAEAAQ